MHRTRVWDWIRRTASPASGEGQATRERSGGRRRSAWLAACASTLVAAACTGTLGSSDEDRPGVEPPGAEAQCAPRLARRIVLLADFQFTNSVRALLGDAAVRADQAPDEKTKPFTKKGIVVGTSLVRARLDRAAYAAESLDGRFEEVTGCAADGDDTCARDFLTRFAAQAFRRPLGATELGELWEVVELGKEESYKRGVMLAVEAILASPSFSYRTELGEKGEDGVVRLSPHEIASELSFFLTDSPPDPDLMAAADSGALGDPEEITRQTERLLALPATRRSLSSTLLAAWGLSNLFGTEKDPGMFPEYGPALQASMFHETELFLDATLWERGADVSDLLSSRETFANELLAKVYGVEHEGAPEEFSPVTLPAEQRAGLLTQASVLTTLSRTDNTSVVARGLFVRGALLCLPKLPSPPETLADEVTDLLNADMTERERADVRAQNATCGACHRGIDPFGLMLENYDPLGRYRETLDGAPIDARGELLGNNALAGSYTNAVEFADAIAQKEEFAACLTRHLITYGTDDDRLAPDDCQVADVVEALPDGARTLPAIVKAIARSSALTDRTETEEE
ncbi:hypothetical protein SOCE26_066420 [Sorangium cellulosum]|uniref:Uncharacterized protein n=1 Tax=Sorangium cellulosum TaxID=56 RepID=A0A2L0F0Y3_SORCE|nr:DUF1592 domain-containing protein [Sorangium cellulosum]AUX45161.1 hypothetical protein SOCE26_066420 [Sorangium cellulosum]